MRSVPLLEVAELVGDRVTPFDGERPYVATGGLNDDGRLDPTLVTFEERPSRADMQVRAGDVCMARMRGTKKVRGFAEGEEDLILSTGFAVLRPGAHLDATYLRHWLGTAVLQSAKDWLCTGAVQPALTNQGMTELTIPLPPIEEQRRIAAVLEAAGELRTKRTEAVDKLDTLTKSIFIDMFGDPTTNPRGWDIAPLAQLGTLDRGVSKHRPRNDPALLGGPWPLVQTGDVASSGGYIRAAGGWYSDLGLAQSRLWPAGTLCITIAANIAKTGILTFDACFPDSVVGFTSDAATTEFVRALVGFLQPILEATAPESAQKNINLKTLRTAEVPVPPSELREQFAEAVDAVRAQHGRLTGSAESMAELFASLQQRAFEGQL